MNLNVLNLVARTSTVSADSELLKTVLSIVGGVLGSAALAWNVYNYHQQQKGFMKLKLECKCESALNKKYIVSKTAIENTSRKYIVYDCAALLILEGDIRFHRGLELVKEELKKITTEPNIDGKNIDKFDISELLRNKKY